MDDTKKPRVGRLEGLTEMKITEISLVKAPKCEVCGDPTEGLGDTEWVCRKDGCKNQHQAIRVTGVYPFKVIK